MMETPHLRHDAAIDLEIQIGNSEIQIGNLEIQIGNSEIQIGNLEVQIGPATATGRLHRDMYGGDGERQRREEKGKMRVIERAHKRGTQKRHTDRACVKVRIKEAHKRGTQTELARRAPPPRAACSSLRLPAPMALIRLD